MKIDATLQIVVAQLWLISHVICYPSFNRGNSPDPDNKLALVPRALTNSFMPGFGKRQGAPHDNDNYGTSLAGSENRGVPYSVMDLGGRKLPSFPKEDTDAGYDVSRAALRALILDYLRKPNVQEEMEPEVDDQILPRRWPEAGERDRLSAVLDRFKQLQQRMSSQGQTAWRPDAYSQDSLKK